MSKETITKSSEGELVRLKYTFKYGDKFDEPNDNWLKYIEVTSDELLGSNSKAEDNALSTTFESRGKNSIITTSVVMDLSLAPTQATRYRHTRKGGPGPGWRNGFM